MKQILRTDSGILLAMERPSNVPIEAQWLAGQGAGSWFYLTKKTNNNFIISRFSPNGEVEFNSNFECSDLENFSIDCPFSFTYLSHFKFCQIEQHGQIFCFINTSL